MSEPTFERRSRSWSRSSSGSSAGSAGLDEAIKLWERGEELLASALPGWRRREGKIEELAQRAAEAAPLSPGDDAG